MTTKARFSTRASGQIEGALCEPPGSGKTGAVVVVHEWHGLNEVMKLHCEHFAQAGFLALLEAVAVELQLRALDSFLEIFLRDVRCSPRFLQCLARFG